MAWHENPCGPEIGETAGRAIVERCSKGKGISTKVAIDTGVPTAASDIFQLYGIYKVFAKYPEIQVVSQQATEYNADKARSIMDTVLKQHPDLCGSIGIWDNQDVGTGSAIAQAGKQKQVYMVTSGGGNKNGCDNVTKGLFSMYISYNVPLQGQGLNSEIARLLQSKDKAGAEKIPYFTPLTTITAKEVNARSTSFEASPRSLDRGAALEALGRQRHSLRSTAALHHAFQRHCSGLFLNVDFGGTCSSKL